MLSQCCLDSAVYTVRYITQPQKPVLAFVGFKGRGGSVERDIIRLKSSEGRFVGHAIIRSYRSLGQEEQWRLEVGCYNDP